MVLKVAVDVVLNQAVIVGKICSRQHSKIDFVIFSEKNET